MNLGHVRWRSLLAIALSALIFVGAGSGFAPEVLCIGADGHVRVERASGGACDDLDAAKPDSERHALDAEHQSDSHCGVCVDIPLHESPYSMRPVASKSQQVGVDDQVVKTAAMVSLTLRSGFDGRHVRNTITSAGSSGVIPILRSTHLII